jgi:hypothetical protein
MRVQPDRQAGVLVPDLRRDHPDRQLTNAKVGSTVNQTVPGVEWDLGVFARANSLMLARMIGSCDHWLISRDNARSDGVGFGGVRPHRSLPQFRRVPPRRTI